MNKAKKAPYGYKTTPDGQVVIDQAQAKEVRRQFKRAVQGKRRLKVTPVYRDEPDYEKFAMVLWMQAKRQAREKREAADQAQNDTSSTPETQ